MLTVVLGLCGAVWAQVDVAGSTPGDSQTMEATSAMDPAQSMEAENESYVGEITGNDVFIRSGPGTTYYQCGKLYKGDQVQVIDERDGWSCITPPPGCFSWIAMQYVSINLENPTVGLVTGNNVGVYAGSDFVPSMYSTTKQVTLKRGQTVKLLSEEMDEYYKIAPPQGSYLWVSSQYVKRAQPVVEETPVEPAEPSETLPGTTPTPVVSQTTEPQTPSEFLDSYYAISKLVKEEQAKPLAQQDYAKIKEQLTALMEKASAGRAAKYAEFTLKQVERFELARVVAQEIAKQKEELAKVNEKIDEAKASRLAEIENLGKFAVIGTLETSSLYSSSLPSTAARRYRVLDASGRTICYVAPTGVAATKDYSDLVGHKVGLVGEIRPHVATGRAFVDFSDIVQLD